MSLSKIITLDSIQIDQDDNITVREKIAIREDGQEINATYENHILVKGDDYSKEHAKVQAVCQAVWA
jgi:type IV secretory pathway ATPase VirB11/archaellum biosynthesis ATPase